MNDKERVYQRIGEFTVSFQWIENKLREIGWFILDHERKEWPPADLRNLTNEKLIERIHQLFLEALPKCKLQHDLETEFRDSFASTVNALHTLRRSRNRIQHSAFIELKAGGEIKRLLRSNPKIQVDEETGQVLFDQEIVMSESLSIEMEKMANVSMFLNRAYIQLINRYPSGGA